MYFDHLLFLSLDNCSNHLFYLFHFILIHSLKIAQWTTTQPGYEVQDINPLVDVIFGDIITLTNADTLMCIIDDKNLLQPAVRAQLHLTLL